MSRQTYLRFHLEPISDEEISCLFCSLPRCEQSFMVSGGNRVTMYGVHNSCADKHMNKLQQSLNPESKE